jgi:hypothetical protein
MTTIELQIRRIKVVSARPFEVIVQRLTATNQLERRRLSAIGNVLEL